MRLHDIAGRAGSQLSRAILLLLLRLLTIALVLSPLCPAYSVLTHEAVVDSAWKGSIQPLLLKRFPNATEDQLREAHAYAYGGCIIQDMGYYPFGSKLLSDLVHYVRSGGFVTNLIDESQTLDEYAFALGSLAHYTSDNYGHPVGVNRVEPMEYPKLRAKFGDIVTYEDDPGAHLKTEFGFDVVNVAQGHYAPKSYHDFIGFNVARPLFERAFLKTYSVPLSSILTKEDLAFGTFRFSVSSLIPEATKAAWAAKKKDIVAGDPTMTKRRFIYNLRHGSYRHDWGNEYQRPGWFARFIAFVFRIIPKVGPFRALAFHPPSAAGEKLLMDSFNATLSHFRDYCRDLDAGHLTLHDTNLDTGTPEVPGKYRLALRAYTELLEKLADQKEAPSPELRSIVVAYFVKGVTPGSPKAQQELAALQSSAAEAQPH